MKVALFCGGRGLRMLEASRTIPKPMVPIGNRPVLWHIMKYYAHFGHTDFVLCLGHMAEAIKEYFLNYQEALTNDFVISNGGSDVQLLERDISEWTIALADTGARSLLGERLRRVKDLMGDEEFLLANYGDVLTDAPLNDMIDELKATGRVASFLAVAPNYTFHTIETGTDGAVTAMNDVADSGVRVNGGYFVFRREIFDYIREGEELVTDVFPRLIADDQLQCFAHDGFWAPMDTLKEQQELERMVEAGGGPWQVWRPDVVANGGDSLPSATR